MGVKPSYMDLCPYERDFQGLLPPCEVIVWIWPSMNQEEKLWPDSKLQKADNHVFFTSGLTHIRCSINVGWMNEYLWESQGYERKTYRWAWKDWEMDEFSEKDLVRTGGQEKHCKKSGRNSGSWKRQLAENDMRIILPRHFFSSLLKSVSEDVCIMVTSGIGSHLFHGKRWETLHKKALYFYLTSIHAYVKTCNKHS